MWNDELLNFQYIQPRASLLVFFLPIKTKEIKFRDNVGNFNGHGNKELALCHKNI